MPFVCCLSSLTSSLYHVCPLSCFSFLSRNGLPWLTHTEISMSIDVLYLGIPERHPRKFITSFLLPNWPFNQYWLLTVPLNRQNGLSLFYDISLDLNIYCRLHSLVLHFCWRLFQLFFAWLPLNYIEIVCNIFAEFIRKHSAQGIRVQSNTRKRRKHVIRRSQTRNHWLGFG